MATGTYTDHQLADAALTALAAVSRDRSRLWARMRRRRKAFKERAAKRRGANVSSQARATSFRLRVRALEKADRNKVLGWAARTYLRWTSRR